MIEVCTSHGCCDDGTGILNVTACHVFDCPEVSHLVLSTIGQAFELRYKLYLNQPTPTALAIPEESVITASHATQYFCVNSFDGDTWGSHPPVHKEKPPDLPEWKVQSVYRSLIVSYTLLSEEESLW